MDNVKNFPHLAFKLETCMAPKRPHDGGQEISRKKQKTADARVIHFQSGPSLGAGLVTNSEWVGAAYMIQLTSFKIGMNGLPAAIDVEKFVEVLFNQRRYQALSQYSLKGSLF